MQKASVTYKTGELQNHSAACTQKYKQFHYVQKECKQKHQKDLKKNNGIRDAQKKIEKVADIHCSIPN